jgi:hypothetical protein
MEEDNVDSCSDNEERTTSVELPLSLVTKRKRGRPKKRSTKHPEPTVQVTINPPKPPPVKETQIEENKEEVTVVEQTKEPEVTKRKKKQKALSPPSTFNVEPPVKVTISALEENKMFFKTAALELEVTIPSIIENWKRLHDGDIQEIRRNRLQEEIEELRRQAEENDQIIENLKENLKSKNQFIKEKTCGLVPSELVINWLGFKKLFTMNFDTDVTKFM